MPFDYEPVRLNRFIVEFPLEFGIDSMFVQKINKPKLINGIWQNIQLEFFETIPESIGEKLFRLVRFCNTQRNSPLFSFNIITVNAYGDETQKWNILVNEIVSVDFGEFDYGSNEIQSVTMNLRPQDCFLNLSSVEDWEKIFKRLVIFEKYTNRK